MTKRVASVALAATMLLTLVQPGLAVTDGGGVWTSRAPLPYGVAEVGVGTVGGEVYALGGTKQVDGRPPEWASTLNMMYDPATNRWQQRAPLPMGLSHIGVASLGGKLYAVGGFTGIVHMGAQDVAFVYDPKVNRWSELPKFSSARGSVAVVAVDGKIHIFGGRDSREVVKLPAHGAMPPMLSGYGTVTTHEIYDPATNRWTSGAPMPSPPRDHVGVAVLVGKVHLFGGRTADVADNLTRHDVYDPKTDRWTTAAPLPRARSAGAYTVLDGLIIYAGGECKPGGAPFTPNAFDDVTAYDAGADRWISLRSLPQARHAFGAATVNHVAYFVGGAAVCGGGTLNQMLALTLK